MSCVQEVEDGSTSDAENMAVTPETEGERQEQHGPMKLDVHDGPTVDRETISSVTPLVGHNERWTMVKVQVGYDITRKGEPSLVIDGFKFTKSRDGMGDRVFWRCSRRECKATAVTVGGRVEHVRAIHSHVPPLPAEFFGGDSSIRGELQEVRFNSNPSTPRPRIRRNSTMVTGTEGKATVGQDVSLENGLVNGVDGAGQNEDTQPWPQLPGSADLSGKMNPSPPLHTGSAKENGSDPGEPPSSTVSMNKIQHLWINSPASLLRTGIPVPPSVLHGLLAPFLANCPPKQNGITPPPEMAIQQEVTGGGGGGGGNSNLPSPNQLPPPHSMYPIATLSSGTRPAQGSATAPPPSIGQHQPLIGRNSTCSTILGSYEDLYPSTMSTPLESNGELSKHRLDYLAAQIFSAQTRALLNSSPAELVTTGAAIHSHPLSASPSAPDQTRPNSLVSSNEFEPYPSPKSTQLCHDNGFHHIAAASTVAACNGNGLQLHWKKEKIRESASRDKPTTTKRRHNELIDPAARVSSSCILSNSYLPAYHWDRVQGNLIEKLMTTLEHLSSCLDMPLASTDDVIEKCRAIRECAQTIETVKHLRLELPRTVNHLTDHE